MSAPRDEDRLLDHQYDEIQEYDNPLPGWWTAIFVVTILWAVVYFANVIPGVGRGKGWIANYQADSTAAVEKYGAARTQAAAVDLAPMEAALADPAQVAAGRAIFGEKCAVCHLPDGGGSIGPNLTDDYWIHGSKHLDILTTITNGVPDKGMLTWRGVLKPEQIAHVAAYVTTLRGTTPEKAKEPQGIRSGEEGQAVPADSNAAK